MRLRNFEQRERVEARLVRCDDPALVVHDVQQSASVVFPVTCETEHIGGAPVFLRVMIGVHA